MKLIYSKNFNLAEMLEQRSVIKFLMNKNCTSHKIYWRKCDLYREPCFSVKKMFTNEMSLSQKDSSLWKDTDSLVKKKIWVQHSIKVMLTVFWEMGWSITIDFLEKKKCNSKQSFLLLTGNIHLIFWMTIVWCF